MKQIYILMLLILSAGLLSAQLSLDLETGVAFTGYNDLQIPNNDANSRLSFTEDLESKPLMFGRLNAHYLITPRHEVSLLYAPLKVKPKGTLDRDIVFMDETFDAGKELQGVYKFNSYRLQYLYRFANQNIGIRAIGLSLKVRDAIISLENEDGYAEKTDLGFVPLIGFEFGYDFNDELGIQLKGEALGSKFGRAEDILLSARYKIRDGYTAYLGYRFLEGGSDIDEVYTFAQFSYLTAGVRLDF